MITTKTMKFIISSVVAFIVSFLGDTAPLVKSVFWLVTIDMITGMLSSRFYKKEALTTRRFMRKIRDLGMFAIALASFILASDAFVFLKLDKYTGALFFCSIYSIYELFSILENLGEMNFPIAKQIKDYIQNKLPKDIVKATSNSGEVDDNNKQKK